VLATRHGKDHARACAHRPLERDVGGGVARVQADDQVDAVQVRVGDVADLETKPARPETPREPLALLDDVRLQVESEHVDVAPVNSRQEVVESERQVRPSRAEVDDPQPPVGKKGDHVLDELDEAVHLPELRPAWSAHAPVRRLHAQRDEVWDRLPFGQQVALGAIVRRGRGGTGRRLPQDARVAATRQHLPVGICLVEERLPVVRADRRDEEARERERIEVLVRRPRRVVAADAPPGTGAEQNRLDRDPSRFVRVGHTRPAQRGTGQGRVADEALDEAGERRSRSLIGDWRDLRGRPGPSRAHRPGAARTQR
jgi:hypothetical protein